MLIGLGIDQGIASCGYAIVKCEDNCTNFEILKSGTIKTPADHHMGKRLLKVQSFIELLLNEYNPNVMGCETFFFNPKMASGRNKSASIMYTNMATGLLQVCSFNAGVPLYDYPPTTVKKMITGNGRATKKEVINAVAQISRRKFKSSEDHEADAIAIGITTLRKFTEEKSIEENK